MLVKLDDMIATSAAVQGALFLFAHVHPNYITFVGIACNFVFPSLYFGNYLYTINALLVVRFFTDVLDGLVARKFKKSSKIGGALDSFCDTSLMFIYSYIIGWVLAKSSYLGYADAEARYVAGALSAATGGTMAYGLVSLGAVTDHASMKEESAQASLTGFLAQLMADNTIVSFVALIIWNYYTMV